MFRSKQRGPWALAIWLGLASLTGCGPAAEPNQPQGAGSNAKISGVPPAQSGPGDQPAEAGGVAESGGFTASPRPLQPSEVPAGYPKPGEPGAGSKDGGTGAAQDAGAGQNAGAGAAATTPPGSTAPASDPGNAAPKTSGDAPAPGGTGDGGSATPGAGTPRR